MKILFDIYHMPQFNFFKHALDVLSQQHSLKLCTVNRGRLKEVIRKDCPHLPLTVLGDYKNNKGTVSLIFRVVLPRIIKLLKYIKREKFDLVITANYQANIAARFLGIPNVGFNDDPEKINLKILKLFGNRVYLPLFASSHRNVEVFNALKEWAYLSPQYFSPDIRAVEDLGLKSKGYIFAREVSTRSMNYTRQEPGTILTLAPHLPEDCPVVISLEDKSLREKYPRHWWVLEEPVADIHSLLYHSSVVISSGDSMAREGAMLGVPSVYCGIREMAANRVLMEKQILFKLAPPDVPAFVKPRLIVNADDAKKTQDLFREDLNRQWQDVTSLITSIVNGFQRGNL